MPALALLWRYPLTHGRMAEIRDELERRRAEEAAVEANTIPVKA